MYESEFKAPLVSNRQGSHKKSIGCVILFYFIEIEIANVWFDVFAPIKQEVVSKSFSKINTKVQLWKDIAQNMGNLEALTGTLYARMPH